MEMLPGGAFLLTWTPSKSEGVVGYKVYLRVDNGEWEKIAYVTETSYVYTDKWYLPDKTCEFRVSSVDKWGREGPPAAATEKSPGPPPEVEIREAEDFNYGGGQYPGYQNCPAANEAPTAAEVERTNDFWHPNKGGPRDYRPNDEIGIGTVEEVDDPGVFHTNIGWIDAGSWWKYTFNVTEPGWIKLTFRVASPNGGTLEAYWDEELVGTTRYQTGNWHIFTWAAIEDQVQTTTGEHTLRVESLSGYLNFDKIAVGFNWTPPARKTIWGDDFESHTALYEQIGGEWTVISGSNDPVQGDPTDMGTWRLWCTTCNDLNREFPALAAMQGNYAISNSDFSAQGVLLNEELISPEIDTDGYTGLRLTFDWNYRIYDDVDHDQIAEADIRVYDPDALAWGEWNNLMHLEQSDVDLNLDPPEMSDNEVLDLSAYDRKIIQVRWHFYDADWDYWFAIDNVRVSGIPMPPPLPPQFLRPGGVTEDTAELCVGPGFGEQYTIQYCDDLVIGNWHFIPGIEWPIAEPRCILDDIRGVRQRFYRVGSVQ